MPLFDVYKSLFDFDSLLMTDSDKSLIFDLFGRFSWLLGEDMRLSGLISKLDAMPLCSGWEYVAAGGVVYIHHSAFDSCPLHGEGKTAQRGARVYVGKKDKKRAAAFLATKNYRKRVQLGQELGGVRDTLDRARSLVARAAVSSSQGRLL